MIRGWMGEQKTKFILWYSLNSNVYHKFHNIIIPASNGTTQIDHLIISKYGLFLIETKNHKGWIFGDERNKLWTQTFKGKKYSFQNPLRQTFRQKLILAEFFEIDEDLVHPIVYFVGSASIKTQLPPNVRSSRLRRYIRYFKTPVLSQEDVKSFVKKIG